MCDCVCVHYLMKDGKLISIEHLLESAAFIIISKNTLHSPNNLLKEPFFSLSLEMSKEILRKLSSLPKSTQLWSPGSVLQSHDCRTPQPTLSLAHRKYTPCLSASSSVCTWLANNAAQQVWGSLHPKIHSSRLTGGLMDSNLLWETEGSYVCWPSWLDHALTCCSQMRKQQTRTPKGQALGEGYHRNRRGKQPRDFRHQLQSELLGKTRKEVCL